MSKNHEFCIKTEEFCIKNKELCNLNDQFVSCDGNNTHSWLLEKDLVYLQWEIEMDGNWGPYQECNLNLTSGGDGLCVFTVPMNVPQ